VCVCVCVGVCVGVCVWVCVCVCVCVYARVWNVLACIARGLRCSVDHLDDVADKVRQLLVHLDLFGVFLDECLKLLFFVPQVALFLLQNLWLCTRDPRVSACAGMRGRVSVVGEQMKQARKQARAA
jgi:hypothetical protein